MKAGPAAECAEQLGFHGADVSAADGKQGSTCIGEGDDSVAAIITGVGCVAQQSAGFKAVENGDQPGLVPPHRGRELGLGGSGVVFQAAELDVVDLSLALGSNVLRFLSFETRPLSELAELARVSKQAISRQVRYLVERGT